MKPITKLRIAAVSTIACLAVLVGCEERQEANTAEAMAFSFNAPHMPKGVPVNPPSQYAEACQLQACTDYETLPVIPWTKDVKNAAAYALLKAKVRPQDNITYPVWVRLGEYKLGGVAGNCVTCSREIQGLLQERFPEYQAAFRLAVTGEIVKDRFGTSIAHMVLTIETDQGTFACDCNNQHCLPYDRVTSKNWALREGPDGLWESFTANPFGLRGEG